MRSNPNFVTLANMTFNDSDFARATYNGESGQVVGVYTSINYGVRHTGEVMLVHNDDYNHTSNSNNEIWSL